MRTKLEPKSFKCLLLGYASDAKGYKLLNLESGKIVISRSVKLDEREVVGIYDQDGLVEWYDSQLLVMEDAAKPRVTEVGDDEEDVLLVPPTGGDVEMEEHMEDDVPETTPPATPTMTQPLRLEQQQVATLPQSVSDAIVFHPTANRRASDRYQSMIIPSRNSTMEPPRMIQDQPHNTGNNSVVVYGNSPSSGSIDRPSKRQRYDDDEGYEIALVASGVPNSYKEALMSKDREEWLKAISVEFGAHKRNGTWTKVKRQPGMKVIKTKWVFAEKFNELG